MSPSRRRRRASPEWEGRQPITVATVPGRSLFARHLSHPEGVDGVHQVTVCTTGAPQPAGASGPCLFETSWLRRNLDTVDVVNVLAVPGRASAEDVAAAAATVREAGKPLVATLYHLSDPTGEDDDRYGQQLTALVEAADAVITLTPTAGEEVVRRWGVEPLVVPHPHAVDFVRMRQERPHRRGGQLLVGMHLANLRCPVDPVEMSRALAEAVAHVGGRLVVHAHEHVMDAGSASYARPAVERVAEAIAGVGTLRLHRPFSDAQLWDHLFSLDVSVVPGLHGSHSVWPEACYDLGTSVVLPAGSHAASQRPSLVFDQVDGVPDTESLVTALVAARDQGSAWRADPADRWKERVQIAERLRGLYERLLGLDRR